jgi:hypothetical protein
VINGLEKPVEVVEKVFGEVIQITEEIIKSILNMIEEMRNLFNARGVETMFLNPFKEAALSALSSIDKLYQLIVSVGSPMLDGVETDIKTSINDVYASLRNDVSSVLSAVNDIKTRVKEDFEATGYGIQEDFMRLKALTESMPVEISVLTRKVRQELRVVGEDAFSVPLVVSEEAKKVGSHAFASVRKTGAAVRTDFSQLEQKIHTRLENENAMLDLLCVVVVGAVIAAIVSIFFLTRSMRLVVFIVVVLAVSLAVCLVLSLLT